VITSSIKRRTTAGSATGRCPAPDEFADLALHDRQSGCHASLPVEHFACRVPERLLAPLTPGGRRTQPVDNAEIVIRQPRAGRSLQGRIFLRPLLPGQYAQEDHDGGAIFLARRDRNPLARVGAIQHSESVTTTAPSRPRRRPGPPSRSPSRERLSVRIVGAAHPRGEARPAPVPAALGIALLAPAVGSVLSMNAYGRASARFGSAR